MPNNNSTITFLPTSSLPHWRDRPWPQDWPPKENAVSQLEVTKENYENFSEIINKRAGEREVEEFLTKHPNVLSLVCRLFSTGHHMTWLFPKAQIRPSSGQVGGLIPDYLVAGKNSDGIQWFVLELKGADKQAFSQSGRRVSLTSDANKGICQLLNYIDHSSRDQAYLRDGLGLSGFREPKGILLIGTEQETECHQVRDFKGAWNRLNPNIQIRSYNRLLRTLEEVLRGFGRI